MEKGGLIDLFFADESGFSLTPYLPYAWGKKGESLTIKSKKTKVCNLFGLLSREGKLKVYQTEKNINSQFINECLDEIAQTIERTTVIILDNATWHTANKIIEKQAEWQQKNLFLFFLPSYSPQLNLIEILWRKIKYEWLRPKDYLNEETLKNAIYHIIKNYDHQFSIQFKDNLF